MEKQEQKMQLPKISVDDLFSTQEERDNAKLEKVVEIPICDIDEFPNHPFKVVVNDEMKEMAESIKEHGVLIPALVRPKKDGGFEMISGHRRKKASELAGNLTIPCIVRELSDDQAIIIMVDSNIQRENILPSEKAFAYKMKLDALNHQGKRNDLTSTPMVSKLRTNEIIGEEVGESREQIRRYIRLTELIPEILNMVDEKKVAFRPAVEISYLDKDNQYVLLDTMEYADCTPSLAQAIHLKKLSQEGNLTAEKIESLLEQEKPNQIPKVKISRNKLQSVLPKTITTDEQIEKFVIQCVEEHNKREKMRNSVER